MVDTMSDQTRGPTFAPDICPKHLPLPLQKNYHRRHLPPGYGYSYYGWGSGLVYRVRLGLSLGLRGGRCLGVGQISYI